MASIRLDRSLFDVGNDRYVAEPANKIAINGIGGGSLATVISGATVDEITKSWLEATLDSYLSQDDVIKSEFFANVFVTGISYFEPRELYTKWGKCSIRCFNPPDVAKILPGPYVASNGFLWQVLKLYDDTQKAFMVTVRRTGNGGFMPLDDGRHGWDCASVTLMSRISSSSNNLAKYRVPLKDVFDLKGMKTSMCNKAYLSLYPPAESNAPAIANLIERGVQILGKTKLSSFL